MPVIEFTVAVGTRFKPGMIANLPLTTLKGLAQEAGLKAEDWNRLGNVRAQGAEVHKFMADLKNQERRAKAGESKPSELPTKPRRKPGPKPGSRRKAVAA